MIATGLSLFRRTPRSRFRRSHRLTNFALAARVYPTLLQGLGQGNARSLQAVGTCRMVSAKPALSMRHHSPWRCALPRTRPAQGRGAERRREPAVGQAAGCFARDPVSRDPPRTGRRVRGVRGPPRPMRAVSSMIAMIVSAIIVDSPQAHAPGGPLGGVSAISMRCGR